MINKDKDRERRARHDRELEESQAALRRSISETERLVGQSEAMLRRHRQEREEDDDDADSADVGAPD